jgi:hypothetical protein
MTPQTTGAAVGSLGMTVERSTTSCDVTKYASRRQANETANSMLPDASLRSQLGDVRTIRIGVPVQLDSTGLMLNQRVLRPAPPQV